MKFPAPLKYQISSGDRRIKYQIFVFCIFTIYYFIFNIAPASAQINNSPTTIASTPSQTNPFTAPNTNPDVPKNLHTYTQNVIIEIMSAATCQLAGIDPTNPNQACLGVDQKTGKIGFVPSSDGGGGAIGVMGKMISVLYTPPLHTGDYFNHLAQNFGIVKPAHAQGTGFEGLKPLLGLWTAFRNIVYLIFTIVFVVIGLAIMFRVKIDPRTVMTIQNQIPKIIVGIVLVTFSYAIAGFLIDIMYTSIYVIGNVVTSVDKEAPGNLVTEMAQTHNPLQAAALIEHQPSGTWTTFLGLPQIAWKPAETVGKFIEPIFDNPVGRIITGVLGYELLRYIERSTPLKKVFERGDVIAKNLATAIGTGLGTIIAPGVGTIIGGVVGKTLGEVVTGAVGAGIGVAFGPFIISKLFSLVVFLIIAIAILWSLFRLWFTLIMAYIYILIDIVFAPFWIAGGIIPGQPVTFGGWLRHILSYIAAFPTTIALFLLGKVFIDAFGTDQKGFVPPLIGNPTDTNAIGAIIGLGIILLSSNVVNMTTKLFKAPSVDFGRIGQAIGVGVGVPMTTVRGIGGAITASREVIARTAGPGGEAKFGPRGLPGSIFGRMFGR